MIDQRKNYEPGRALKRFLLSVRKVARKFGSIELPGLFDVAYGTRDGLLFAVAVILEIYGLYNLWLVGDILLMAAAGLFALDVVAALMWHCGQSRRTELANLLAVTSDPAERASHKAGYPISFTFVRLGGLLAILGLAGFKMLTFMSFAGGGTPLGVLLLIAVTYGLVALIHIFVTGYFLANATFQIAKAVELRRTLRHKPLKDAPNTVKGHRHHQFGSSVKLVAASVGRHALICLGESAGGFLYDLKTWGLLLDAELSDLILQQHDMSQKATLAEEGLRAQLEILDSDPVAAPQSVESGEPALAPVPVPDTPAPKSGVLREIGEKAAVLLLGLSLLGLVSCADRKRSADTLDRVPVTVLLGDAGAASAEEWKETLLSIAPETPILTQEGSRSAIPTLTLLRAGALDVDAAVTVTGDALPTFIDEVWGRQPDPDQHLADLRERLAGLDLSPLLATSAPPMAAAEPAVFEASLVSQIQSASNGDSSATVEPLVVYWEDEAATDPAPVGSDRPAGPVVHNAAEWHALLADTVSRGIVPIVLAFKVPAPRGQPDPIPTPERAKPVDMPEPVPPLRRLFSIMGSEATRDAVMKTAEGWLRREGVTSIATQSDDSGTAVTLRGTAKNGGQVEIRIEPADSAAAFGALSEGRCEGVMGAAGGMLATVLGNGDGQGSPAQATEHVLGIVPAAVAVHPANPLHQITLDQLGDLLTGRIVDWRELGGASGPVTVLAPQDGPELDRLLARRMPGLSSGVTARRLPEGEIAAAIAADPRAIGLLPLNRAGAAIQVLRLAADDLGLAIAPDASTVARDDYPLCQVYSLYLSAGDTADDADAEIRQRRLAAREFVRYATLDSEGQALVAQAGFYGQNVRFQTWGERERVVVARRVADVTAESGPERRFREMVAGAEQASMVFRFGFNDTTLDARSQANVERLASLLLSSPEQAGSRLILIGFADSVGTDRACEVVSENRAEAVRDALLAYGVNAEVAAGFGKQLPVDTNATDEGRARNRRVEVWLKRPEKMAAQTAGPAHPAE